jgi:hypothetical protein
LASVWGTKTRGLRKEGVSLLTVKNPADLPEAIQRIAQQTTQERKDAFAWLEWKDARKNCWVNVGIFAAVIAAVFSVLSFFALFK